MALRQYLRYSLWISLIGAGSVTAQTPETVTQSLTVTRSSERIEWVEFRLILTDSIDVRRNRNPVPTDQYQVDFGHRRIFIRPALEPGDSLMITYRVLPFLQQLTTSFEYFRRPAVIDPDSSIARPQRNRGVAATGQSLRRTGSIYRGFRVGSENSFGIESGMNIFLEGPISDDVSIRAVITDESIPVQPEGTSQQLSEIDRIYLQINTPSTQSVIGDFNLDQTSGYPFQRRLKGLNLQYQTKPFRAAAVISTARAKFQTFETETREGVQGPYQLYGQNQVEDLIIIAGSETVYLDGEKLRRGDQQDYIIEYGDGTLQFTGKRLIRANQRLEVDFEYVSASQRYGQQVNALDVAFKGARHRFSLFAANERDDDENPLGSSASLTDEERDLLASAGDRSDFAVRSGVRRVTDQSGQYRAELSSENDTIYVYSPSGAEYDITFSRIGSNKGRYRRVSRFRNEYEFVGLNQADYEPVILIPAPQSTQFLKSSYSFNDTHTNVDLSADITDRDLNHLSSRGDSDNTGLNSLVTIAHTFTLPDSQSLRIMPVYRYINQNYNSPYRYYPQNFLRNWGFVPINRTADRHEATMDVLYRAPGQQHRLQWEGYREAEHLMADAITLNNQYRNRYPIIGQWRSLLRITESRQTVLNSRLRDVRWEPEWVIASDLSLSAAAQWNQRQADSLINYGFIREQYTASWRENATPKEGLRATVDLERTRIFDSDRDTHTDFSRSLSPSIAFQKQWSEWAMNFDAKYRERLINDDLHAEQKKLIDPLYLDSSAVDQSSLRIETQLDYRDTDGGIQFRLKHTAQNELTSFQEVVYQRVRAGLGQYRFDSLQQRYIPDDIAGDFLRYIIPNGQYLPVSGIQLDLNLLLSPEKLNWTTLSDLQFQTRIRLSDQQPQVTDLSYFFLNPARYIRRETLNGHVDWVQDIYFFRSSQRRNHQLQWRFREQTQNTFVDAQADLNRYEREQEVRLKNRFQPNQRWLLNAELGLSKRIQRNPARPELNLNTLQAEMLPSISYEPQSATRIRLDEKISFRDDQNAAGDLTVLLWSNRFNLDQRVFDHGRLTVGVTADWVETLENSKNRTLNYELTDGLQEGLNTNWNVNLDYQLGDQTRVQFRYSGRKFPIDPSPFHFVQMELRYSL